MNKLVLLIGLIFSIHFGYGQCTPLAQYADSTFGVWPDTVQNLPHAIVNQAYSTTLYLKAPSNATELGAGFALTIDSLRVDSVSGMPTGFTHECDNSRCVWGGGDHGCFSISGTPTQTGTYVLNIHTTGYAGGGMFSAPYTFDGYKLVVDEATSVQEIETEFYLEQNIPNPTKGNTLITYTIANRDVVQLEIFNLLGEVVYTEQVYAAVGKNQFIVSGLIEGQYIYKVSTTDHSAVKKMIVLAP